ncbi:hypothetical protein [Bradyrhizobium sp. AUGA SZCCT0160]|uniref:hypothetical protein n=1 Tax=Bradyrhizobium sp. AUGA SZCCT0160 TaxID=2807662 RepID=UPI001BAD016D|nr:hypothetical protein [Bradyrhizobium sp. AUGA SZCCT0160]MBR1190357.1 hypothetical protein [Bradyrhizobium sp. AUGA SZCCT0160]
MASERQVTANRINARKSTGPKTRAGRQRIRTNAYRHGLAAVFNRESRAEIEIIARELAGDTTNPIILQHARDAAYAVFVLARIKVLRIAWVQRAYELGTVEFPPKSAIRKSFFAFLEGKAGLMALPFQTMPPEGPERLSEAIHRALTQLANLDRYEARAVALRNRAFRVLVSLQGKN